eukprot:m.41800 g.41800  ORF g.41800 m.41800 type:complete len:82 (-) comp18918_c0_seq1:325-570(-)
MLSTTSPTMSCCQRYYQLCRQPRHQQRLPRINRHYHHHSGSPTMSPTMSPTAPPTMSPTVSPHYVTDDDPNNVTKFITDDL